MRKKIFAVCICAAVLLLAGLGLWYTRPMTLEQSCPGIDLSECREISISCSRYTEEDGRGHYDQDTRDLLPGDPAFSAALELLQDRSFRRSLLSLLPRGGRTHQNTPGDFQWGLDLCFEDIPLSDGGTGSGYMLRLDNFYGTLEISFDAETWQTRTDGQTQWLSDVMAVLEEA